MMVRAVRVVGIAIASVVIAYLAVSLVGGLILGWGAGDATWTLLAAVVLGGLVFADIMRRERRGTEGGRSEGA